MYHKSSFANLDRYFVGRKLVADATYSQTKNSQKKRPYVFLQVLVR